MTTNCLKIVQKQTRDVAESADDAVVLVVDDDWTELLLVATVAGLALAGAVALRVVYLK